ncbi:MAG: HAD-IIIC family phosphatase [Candidatus Sericytochromatia bacterium]|nr:HAD-IIIC family phosphatase [Candidatus Sericytochromatia bacterium]
MQAVAKLDQLDHAWKAEGSVYVLRNVTVEGLAPFIKLPAYRQNLRLNVTFSDYDTYQQDLLDPASRFHESRHDLVVLALWLDTLAMAFDGRDALQAEAVFDHVQNVVAQIKQHTDAPIAINTFLPPFHHQDEWCPLPGLAALNQRLRDAATSDGQLLLVDFDRLLGTIGMKQGLDRRYWFRFKAPAGPAFLQAWGRKLAQAVASLKGLSRKVLILDCDNTLWGGVIGEDGLAGIQLSPHDYPGNVYHAFQRQVLALQQQGILLALCSKNNEDDVFAVMRDHPDCIIRHEHLAGWRINWQDKAANLIALAEELRLGLDSFVFIDDSPTECDRIRQSLPEVAVLQVPSAIHELPSLLQEFQGFMTLTLSAEDQVRTELYQLERQRRQVSAPHGDLADFVASLALKASIGEARIEELARVAQLTQKTNQFNLTTRRYSESEIGHLAADPESLVLIMKVADTYGEYGLTGVAIARRESSGIHVDTFLLSCRILGRQLETVFLREVLALAAGRWGPQPVRAEFIRTAKNDQVATFFDNHAFVRDGGDTQHQHYVLPELPIQPPIPYITVVRRA